MKQYSLMAAALMCYLLMPVIYIFKTEWMKCKWHAIIAINRFAYLVAIIDFSSVDISFIPVLLTTRYIFSLIKKERDET